MVLDESHFARSGIRGVTSELGLREVARIQSDPHFRDARLWVKMFRHNRARKLEGGASMPFSDHSLIDKPIPDSSHIAILLRSLKGGGMETSMMRLAGGLAARGLKVDVVVADKLKGPGLERAPQNVRLISLARSRVPWWTLWRALRPVEGGATAANRPAPLPIVPPRGVCFLPPLIRYLDRERPDALIAGGTIYNLIALWARRLTGLSMRVVISERNSLSAEISSPVNRGQWHLRHAPQLVASTYPSADAIVANSNGVAADLANCTGLRRDAITTIYNPVVDSVLTEKALTPVAHPWFAPDMPPVVLGVGRLHPQKDFPTLLRAFARVRAWRDARLVILGADAKHGVRAELMSLAASLGVTDDVDMPGFAANPFAFMARAGVFVLSSRNEGCPNVLIEAMACGCPVVSTRCPHGPDEILDDGRYGRLVDVGDDDALAQAIAATLDQRPDRDCLRARAAEFGIDRAVDQYLACLERVAGPTGVTVTEPIPPSPT